MQKHLIGYRLNNSSPTLGLTVFQSESSLSKEKKKSQNVSVFIKYYKQLRYFCVKFLIVVSQLFLSLAYASCFIRKKM